MFKLIFRSVFTILLLSFVISGLVIWRGGDDFRWIGKKVENMGIQIASMGKQADKVKEFREKTFNNIKMIQKNKEKVEKDLKIHQ